MGDSTASYIRMVQHLIEKCLLFNMNQDECVEALSKHANIMPVITNTVWKELEKENREFFEQYAKNEQELQDHSAVSETELADRIQKLITDTAAEHSEGKAGDDEQATDHPTAPG